MSLETTPKVANIRLKSGKEPITVSGLGYASNRKAMRFPTLERQKNGWCSAETAEIIAEHGDRYELIGAEGDPVGGN